jgi:predicted alpha/beta superfamily hydrolase
MGQRFRTAVDRLFRPDRVPKASPGTVARIDDFESANLPRRGILVYLPPDYDAGGEPYRVLYMHDGQNLFDPATAFIPGEHWHVAESADALIRAGRIEPLVIIGIENAGGERIHEYTPTHDPDLRAGGRATDYTQMLIEEVMPLIASRYRVSLEREHVAVAGSSLGALVSLHAGLARPDVFGGVGAMSPSVWWHQRAILREVDRFRDERRPRIWLDIGSREGKETVADVRLLRDRLRDLRWSDSDLRYHEDRRGEHNERSWARRMPLMLQFLFRAGKVPRFLGS